MRLALLVKVSIPIKEHWQGLLIAGFYDIMNLQQAQAL
jgi:hypothetical protein